MESKNSLSMPIAIVIAGVIIAFGVYISGRNNPNNSASVIQANQQGTKVPTADIPIAPVSQKDYIRGNPDAKVVLVEFSDPECPFCKVFQGTMKDLSDKYGKDGTLAWVYRNFPIKELHSKAPKEAEALMCAGKLGGNTAFWQYTDTVYARTTSNNTLDAAQLPVIAKDVGLDVKAFNTCLSSGEMAAVVEADHQDALNSGGRGTPYSVLIPSKAFDRATVEKFLTDNMVKYGFPADLFLISNDNKKVSVSGAMPEEFMGNLITVLSQ